MLKDRFQCTLGESIRFKGIGLHSGQKITVKIRPAPVDSGILFIRSDIKKSPYIKACPENVVSTKLATTVGINGISISTVEHLMGAFRSYGIDNVIVEVDNVEIPILDGSAMGYTYLFEKAKVLKQNRLRKFLVIKKSFRFCDGDRELVIYPYPKFKINYKISFPHPLIKTQTYSYEVEKETFETEIAPARTFGFAKDVEKLRKIGLAKGGSLNSAVVLDDYGLINKEGLRFPNEFVRHKILDLIGDITIVGTQIMGEIHAVKSGHDMHIKFLKELLKHPECYQIITISKRKAERLLHFGWEQAPVKVRPAIT